MARFLKSRAKAKGLAPGSLVFIGQQKVEKSSIKLISYSESSYEENEVENIDKALNSIKGASLNWINIDGIHDIEIVKKVGEHFKLNNLALENILNTGQRAKFFEDNNYLNIICKGIFYDDSSKKIIGEQISFVLLENTLISFQEKPGDHFEGVRNRLRDKVGKIRQRSADYLLYALLDSLVDNYLIITEQIGSQIEASEEKIIANDNDKLSNILFYNKKELAYFKKSIKPFKEVLTRILKYQGKLISSEHLVFYEELYDLNEQAIDAVDNYFNMSNDMINLYNTNLSNKTNDVMKVLTIYASIFIPLTFVAGIYGTNFDYLPELHFKYSYFAMLGLMLLIAVFMLIYFRRKKWL